MTDSKEPGELLNEGAALVKQGKLDEAIAIFRSIKYEDSPKQYAKAQFILGVIFELKYNFQESIECYSNSSDYLYFHANARIRILKIKNTRMRGTLSKLRETILNLMDNLIISPFLSNYESKFAHYTKTSVAWEIIFSKTRNNIKKERNNEKASAFRLSLIKNVNDPMEGLTLYKFLQQSCLLSKELSICSKTTNISEYAFISCFTLNHDSFNQFRLYGKENNQEASGVSLVFPSDFFDSNPDNHINAIIGLKNNKTLDHFKEQNTEIDSNSKQLLNKQPLYRCIYLDPDTGYVGLARRDKTTFYRELYANGKNIEEISEEADKKWDSYFSSITNKEKEIKEYLKIISYKIKELSSIQDISKEEKKHIFETLHFILLPLQYLVKHAAFQEEQECRMIYITSLDNEKVQLDWESKQVYIEYEPEVKAYLDKIYLSPGALVCEDFFRHELDDPKNPKKKVRISSNPFRDK